MNNYFKFKQVEPIGSTCLKRVKDQARFEMGFGLGYDYNGLRH
jgi:hypothetical protein